MGNAARPYPTANGAYEGIELLPVAARLGALPRGVFTPQGGRLEFEVSLFGKGVRYTLFPHCWAMGKSYVVVYYVAYNRVQQRSEWAVGPRRVADFEDHGGLFAWSAGLFYGTAKEAHPSAVEIVAAQRLASMGRPGAALKAHMKAVKSMWTDPVVVLGAMGEIAAVAAWARARGAAGSAAGARPKTASNGALSPPPHRPQPVHHPGLPGPPVVSPVYRIHGRDIVVVDTPLGRRAFYRSTGRNSGMPETWLPVDELYPGDGWFNKAAYVHGPGREKGQPLYRYGHPELKRVSEKLGRMNIRRGSEIPGGTREPPEDTLNRILDFFEVEITPTTAFRPIGDEF